MPRTKKKSITPGRGSNPIDTALHALYYNPDSPAAYSGVQPLLKAARQQGLKVSRTHVSAWLAQQDTYTLHRPARRHYPRNRVVVGGMDSQWQADLVDMTAFTKENDNNRYLLTCIDVLSKYAWVIPLRAKTGARLIEAFQQIFKTGRRPLYLQTDEGKEFLNRPFQAFLKDKGVFFFHTFNETKASVVERFNRTLKGRMYKYFTAHNTRRYLDALPALVRGYNQAYHRSIRRAPIDVTPQNQKEVRQVLYGPSTHKRSVHRYRAGDLVRISKVKGKFEKSYLPNWSTEMFRIVRSHPRQPAVYTLEDLNGDQLLGTFYETELQPVTAAVDKFYQVEKILKRERRRGKLYYWVKWVGYPPSFNSWVPATDVKRI
ncbi:uncharacterized protein LOC135465490 [Liolophura sinensis]|uniref:uncharacterized protein LOC135465490 n=1 Tax=Liolophura sinensis TaxID=3198878 RepID=UPI003158505D